MGSVVWVTLSRGSWTWWRRASVAFVAVVALLAGVAPQARADASDPSTWPVGVFGVTMGTGEVGGTDSDHPQWSGRMSRGQITGDYDSATTEQQTLQAVRATRQAAYDDDVPVRATDEVGGGDAIGVKEYLSSVGESESSYVDIEWSQPLEQIADQRAAEGSVLTAHERPGGDAPLVTAMAASDDETSEGEVLGFNYPSAASTIDDGYDSEKNDYLDEGANFSETDGHYAILVSPLYRTVGMGRIELPDGYSTDAGEFGVDPTDSQADYELSGAITVPFLAAPGLLEVSAVSAPAQLAFGGSGTAQVSWVTNNQFVAEPFRLVGDGDVAADGTFTSSAGSVLKVDGSGNLSGLSAGTSTITYREPLNGSSASATVSVAPAFSDIAGDPFASDITWLRQQGIATGWPDGTFRPLEPITRDAMAAFLYRLEGSPAYTPPAPQSPFTDITSSTQYYKEICWLKDQGISTGWPDGSYRPLAPIDRDAMAAFLWRLAGSPATPSGDSSPFTDVAGDPFAAQIDWARSVGITSGWPDDTFRPLQPIDRDAMAAFLHRWALRYQGGVAR